MASICALAASEASVAKRAVTLKRRHDTRAASFDNVIASAPSCVIAAGARPHARARYHPRIIVAVARLQYIAPPSAVPPRYRARVVSN